MMLPDPHMDVEDTNTSSQFTLPLIIEAEMFSSPEILFSKITFLDVKDKLNRIRRVKVLYIPYLSRFYQFGRVLKKTIYGALWQADEITRPEGSRYYEATGTMVAIKEYEHAKLSKLRPECKENPKQEFAAMQMIGKHPQIMELLVVCQESSDLYAIMPFHANSDDLFAYLEAMASTKHRFFNCLEIRAAFFQIFTAYAYIHDQMGIAHRDISLENILVLAGDQQREPKYLLIDFGMCMKLTRSPQQATPGLANGTRSAPVYLPVLKPGYCGKDYYIAPEIYFQDHRAASLVALPPAQQQAATGQQPATSQPIQQFHQLMSSTHGQGIDLIKADIWSLGSMLFILLTGQPIVHIAYDERTGQKRPQAATVRYQWILPSLSAVSATTVSATLPAMQPDSSMQLDDHQPPAASSSAGSSSAGSSSAGWLKTLVSRLPNLQHPLDDSLLDLMERMLHADPVQRIDMLGIKKHPFFADYHHSVGNDDNHD